MASIGQVILKPRKAGPFVSRHPWVLDKAIARLAGEPGDGDQVDLLSDTGRWIARGLLNGRSRIRVRLYSWQHGELLDDGFWRRRIEAAVALRGTLGYDDPQGAARLVFSEADGLSGLVVDRFGRHLVVQPTALAMAVRLERLVPLLAELLGPESITVRTEPGSSRMEGIELQPAVRHGRLPAEPVTIREHGLQYRVELLHGQKTGFYLDQRENRRAAAGYLGGRRVLDLCCYTGGFALAALALGGATEVVGFDTSAAAVELAAENAALNGLSTARFEVGDCFRTVETLVAEGRRFGGVVLDPPKFARGRRQIGQALRAYHRLNRLAVELLEPDGVLVTCSCSGSVSREDFLQMLFGVALKSRREIQVLEQRGAAPDHPLSVTCPETDYLKCFICHVR